MEHENSRNLFLYLLIQCKNRDKKYPILIRGYTAPCRATDNPLNIETLFYDKSRDFGSEVCLAEMLIKYPNLHECVWNKPKVVDT